jgi:hypothetical protein
MLLRSLDHIFGVDLIRPRYHGETHFHLCIAGCDVVCPKDQNYLALSGPSAYISLTPFVSLNAEFLSSTQKLRATALRKLTYLRSLHHVRRYALSNTTSNLLRCSISLLYYNLSKGELVIYLIAITTSHAPPPCLNIQVFLPKRVSILHLEYQSTARRKIIALS